MKINWGTGITIAIISFISFIVYLGYRMVTDNQYNHTLVTDEYYQEELKFQEKIDAEKNANKLTERIKVGKIKEGLMILIPKSLNPEEIKGNVKLYRPSNSKLDFKMPIKLTNHKMTIPAKRLVNGRWDVSILFTYKGEKFFHKQALKY